MNKLKKQSIKTIEYLDNGKRVTSIGTPKRNFNISMCSNEVSEQVICPICNKLAPWVENKEMYGKNYGKSYMCYYCKDCDTYVGCHNNTKKPLGTMATRELREYRKKVHAKIDPLWSGDKHKRGEVYAFITKQLGYQYHTGEANIETCKKILEMEISL